MSHIQCSFSFAAFAKWVICCSAFTSLPTPPPLTDLTLSSTSSFLLPWWIATNSVAAAHFIIELCLHRFLHLWSNSGTVASFDLLMGLLLIWWFAAVWVGHFVLRFGSFCFSLSSVSLSLQILSLSLSLQILPLSLSSSHKWINGHTYNSIWKQDL